MKARTKIEKQVAASNAKLTAIGSKVIDWALRNVVEHIAFRTSKLHCTCGDCGTKFDYKGKDKYIHCPHCKRKLKVVDSLARKQEYADYFSTIEAMEGLQVQRTFLLKVAYRKGKPMTTSCDEVCRLWLNEKGKLTLTSRTRTLGYYWDSFNWASSIELRRMTNVHWHISDTQVYPHYSLIPQLRRNGMGRKFLNCHPMRLIQALLSDNRIETLMKVNQPKAVEYFVNHAHDLESCWQSYKIAVRHQYEPLDFGLWCDTVKLLDRCGRDTRSPQYICPNDLKREHDRWLAKVNRMEEKRRNEERMERAKQQEADFYKQKSCFFGIAFSDSDLEISVLDSIEAYQAEGQKMKHCVFQCEYYAKADSIILSAHDHQGNRLETVEFSESQGRVVQSRGVCNSNTPYHDRIINLVNANAYRFLEARRAT